MAYKRININIPEPTMTTEEMIIYYKENPGELSRILKLTRESLNESINIVAENTMNSLSNFSNNIDKLERILNENSQIILKNTSKTIKKINSLETKKMLDEHIHLMSKSINAAIEKISNSEIIEDEIAIFRMERLCKTLMEEFTINFGGENLLDRPNIKEETSALLFLIDNFPKIKKAPYMDISIRFTDKDGYTEEHGEFLELNLKNGYKKVINIFTKEEILSNDESEIVYTKNNDEYDNFENVLSYLFNSICSAINSSPIPSELSFSISLLAYTTLFLISSYKKNK